MLMACSMYDGSTLTKSSQSSALRLPFLDCSAAMAEVSTELTKPQKNAIVR